MSKAPQDFIDLFQYLNAHQVEYLIVGGYALTFYGYPVHTDDLDLFIAPNQNTIQRLLQALNDFGFSDLGLTANDFLDPDKLVSLGYPPEKLDMVTAISGVSWQDAWGKRRSGSFYGVPVQIISKELLIKNKRARGRPEDLKEADTLEQLDIDAYVEQSPFTEPSIP